LRAAPRPRRSNTRPARISTLPGNPQQDKSDAGYRRLAAADAVVLTSAPTLNTFLRERPVCAGPGRAAPGRRVHSPCVRRARGCWEDFRPWVRLRLHDECAYFIGAALHARLYLDTKLRRKSLRFRDVQPLRQASRAAAPASSLRVGLKRRARLLQRGTLRGYPTRKQSSLSRSKAVVDSAHRALEHLSLSKPPEARS
jgi:hypothetical protein